MAEIAPAIRTLSGAKEFVALSYGNNINTKAAINKTKGTTDINHIMGLLPETLKGLFVLGSF